MIHTTPEKKSQEPSMQLPDKCMEALLNSLKIGVIVTNTNNELMFYNQSAEHIFNEITNCNFSHVNLLKIDWLNDLLKECMNTLEQQTYEDYFFKTKVIPINFHKKNSDLCYFCIQIEEKSSEMHSMLSQVSDCSPGSLYWKDLKGIYLGCNQTMVKTAGLDSKAEIIGKTDKQLWPDNAKKICDNDELIISTQKSHSVEEKVEISDGTIMFFSSVKAPLKDIEGRIIGVIGNSLDITKRKQAEILKKKNKKIEQQKKDAEKVSATMRLIASSIAHELRTPLCAITSGVQGLERFLPELIEGYSMAKENDLLETHSIRKIQFEHLSNLTKVMTKEINSANFVINMLLKNITPHLDNVQHENISINAVIAETLSVYPFEGNEKTLVHWSRSEDFMVSGNKELLKHVFYNFLKNSLFYIKEARKGEIYIHTEVKKDESIIYFKDTAKGISQNETKHLFDAFYSKRHGGTGIGLAFCKMVIENAHGKITCKGEPGKFLEYKMVFPVIKQS